MSCPDITHDNRDTSGALTSDPSNVDGYNRCGTTYPPANDPVLTSQLACDTQLAGPCPAGPGANYPRASNIKLKMPPAQQTMRNPAGKNIVNPLFTLYGCFNTF